VSCRNGHPWGPAPLRVSWTPGERSAAAADPGRGYWVVHCPQPGCAETWPTDPDTLRAVLEDQASQATADRDSTEVMAAWTLLLQAREHQRGLMTASHPSAARVAELRSWIQGCVAAVDTLLRSHALNGEEAANLTDIAAEVPAVLDAFHLYASMLDRYRKANRAASGSPRPGPLAAVADDERVLLGSRADLRESMQRLIAVL
jgi:hypothetical protein